MKKIKIVHAADLHFDTPFKDVGEMQSKINKEELKEVFINIINFCKKESVDILLLAGDIFDNFTISKETIYFMENTFKNIMNTRVFISPGNHDPFVSGSFYKMINWPDNVHIFKGSIEKVYINELEVNIWGSGFSDRYVKSSMLKNFNINDENKINIMVMHGEISSSKDGNEYNPITVDEISKSGLDYIALGHRHSFSGINKELNTFYAYSGCPQGRGFDELGDKGIIYGFISKGFVDLDFVKTSKRNYEEVNVDISNTFGYEEVVSKVLESINEKDRKNNFYKVILIGEISEEFTIDEEILSQRLCNEFYFVKVIDKTTILLDLDEISKGYSVKSIFVKKMLEELESLENEEDREIMSTALKLGISSLTEGEVKIDDY